MSYVIKPAVINTIPVSGVESSFPVNNVFCVGRNYADHAREMGADPDREAPFFFIKPAFSILTDGAEMTYPGMSDDVHHEVELVVALGDGGQNVSVEEAPGLIYGYCVGIDMTRRDLQAEAKEKSRPWEAGKTFLHAAPCGNLLPIIQSGEINAGAIQLSIEGDIRQSGDVNQMIWKVPEVISRLSELFVLQPGDLIFTGTPAGVGPVQRGDLIEASIGGLPELQFKVCSA